MEFEDSRIDHFDTLINFIKLLNVNIIGALREPRIPKQNVQKIRYIQRDLDKFVSKYDKRYVKEQQQPRVSLPPIIFRKDFDQIHNQNFMRIQKNNYCLKYVFLRKDSQYYTNVELYKLNGGFKQTSLALQKLQILFLNDLNTHITSNHQITRQFLESEAEKFLKDLIALMSGIQCEKCKKFMALNVEAQVSKILTKTLKK